MGEPMAPDAALARPPGRSSGPAGATAAGMGAAPPLSFCLSDPAEEGEAVPPDRRPPAATASPMDGRWGDIAPAVATAAATTCPSVPCLRTVDRPAMLCSDPALSTIAISPDDSGLRLTVKDPAGLFPPEAGDPGGWVARSESSRPVRLAPPRKVEDPRDSDPMPPSTEELLLPSYASAPSWVPEDSCRDTEPPPPPFAGVGPKGDFSPAPLGPPPRMG